MKTEGNLLGKRRNGVRIGPKQVSQKCHKVTQRFVGSFKKREILNIPIKS